MLTFGFVTLSSADEVFRSAEPFEKLPAVRKASPTTSPHPAIALPRSQRERGPPPRATIRLLAPNLKPERFEFPWEGLIMLMSEFVSRFAAKEETSPLFDILRRVGQLDRKALLATAVDGWAEWPPIDGPDGSGIGLARA